MENLFLFYFFKRNFYMLTKNAWKVLGTSWSMSDNCITTCFLQKSTIYRMNFRCQHAGILELNLMYKCTVFGNKLIGLLLYIYECIIYYMYTSSTYIKSKCK